MHVCTEPRACTLNPCVWAPSHMQGCPHGCPNWPTRKPFMYIVNCGCSCLSVQLGSHVLVLQNASLVLLVDGPETMQPTSCHECSPKAVAQEAMCACPSPVASWAGTLNSGGDSKAPFPFPLLPSMTSVKLVILCPLFHSRRGGGRG
jgi:hypothetical protein